MKPHKFEVFEGEDASDPTIWCKHCNTPRDEIAGMHLAPHVCPVCEGPTDCTEPDCVEGCAECEAKASAA